MEKCERTRRTIDWRAAVWAGVIGGGVVYDAGDDYGAASYTCRSPWHRRGGLLR